MNLTGYIKKYIKLYNIITEYYSPLRKNGIILSLITYGIGMFKFLSLDQ